MSKMTNQIKELVEDPAIVRIVKVIDRASLSILELLEYGVTQKEINHALNTGVIVFDKTTRKYGAAESDYYYEFLNSKVKLSELGLLLLQCVKSMI